MARSLMSSEAAEAAARIRAQVPALEGVLGSLKAELRERPPVGVVTCARGSSDHVAHFAKYAIETMLGLPVASIGPSVVSVYDATLRLEGFLFVAVSQSGRSPDLVACARAAAIAGAVTVAVVNVVDSPLAEACRFVVPIGADEERAVAATKSVLCSQAALLRLLAAWADDDGLGSALDALPGALEEAGVLDWSGPLIPAFADARSGFVVSRGAGLGVAAEAALKLKETSAIPVEAISAAEIQHGPKAASDPRSPLLALGSLDAGQASVDEAARALSSVGVPVFSAGGEVGHVLPIVRTGHPLTQPLAHLAAFYQFAEALAVSLGRDPDNPPTLAKVTKTL